MVEFKPGDWCLGVYCKRCNTPIPLFKDKSAGKNPVKFAGPGKLSVKCPKCKEQAQYGTDAVQRFQVHTLH